MHTRAIVTFRDKYAKCVLHRVPRSRVEAYTRRQCGDRTGCNSRGKSVCRPNFKHYNIIVVRIVRGRVNIIVMLQRRSMNPAPSAIRV